MTDSRERAWLLGFDTADWLLLIASIVFTAIIAPVFGF